MIGILTSLVSLSTTIVSDSQSRQTGFNLDVILNFGSCLRCYNFYQRNPVLRHSDPHTGLKKVKGRYCKW